MLSPSEFNNAVPKFTNGNYANNPVDPQYIEEPTLQDYNRGVEPLETLPAQWWNWLCNQFTSRFNKINTYVKNIFDEITQLLSLLNISPDGTESAITTGQLKNFFKELYPTYVSDKLELGTTYVPQTRTVNGHALTGNVTITKGDVGLGNVDNTSDMDKPVSMAQATAISTAIGALDVESVGGSGKYLSAISETDGKISATAGDISGTVTSGDNAPVSGGAVADILSNLPTDAVLHYSFDDLPDYPDGTADVRLLDNNTYDIQSTDNRFYNNGGTTFSNNNGNVQLVINGSEWWNGVYFNYRYTNNKLIKIKLRITAIDENKEILLYTNNANLDIFEFNKIGEYEVSFIAITPGSNTVVSLIYRQANSATVIIEQIYIGDGSYSTPVIDNANGKWNSASPSGVAVQGVSGKAMSLYNKNVSAGNFNFSQNFTISMWLNPFVAYTGNTRRALLHKNGVILLCDGSELGGGNTFELHFVQNGEVSRFTFGSRLPVNQWTSFVLIKDGSFIKIYQNGSIISTLSLQTSVVDTSNDNLLLGHIPEGELLQNISYDDLLIFGRALSEKEVLALYYNKANTPKYYDLDDYKFANGDTAPTANSNNFVESKTLYNFFGGNTSANSWLGKVFGWALGKNWTQATGFSTTPTIFCIHYANGIWIAGSTGIYWSTDGITWTQVTGSISNKQIETIYYANGVWVAGTTTNGAWWSTDGITWTQGTGIDTNRTITCFYYANNIWVAGSRNIGFWWSTDGKSWTQGSNTSSYAYDVYYGNDIWVFSCNDGLWWSTDGKNWTKGTTNVQGTVDPHVVYFANGEWKAGYSSGILRSTDGKDWIIEINTGNFIDIYYANGTWVGASTDVGVWFKKDNKWIQTDITFNSISVYYANNTWVINTKNRGFWWSSDGETWMPSNISNYTEGQSAKRKHKTVFYGNGIWVAGGYNRAGLWWSSYENAGLE